MFRELVHEITDESIPLLLHLLIEVLALFALDHEKIQEEFTLFPHAPSAVDALARQLCL